MSETTFGRIPKGCKTEPYKDALDIAKMLLMNYSPDISHGRERMLALLFDMNSLWEGFVIRMLKRASAELVDVKVIGQDTKPFWGNNYLQPDIVIQNGDQTAIIDTKWKHPKKQVASIGDLRQM